MRTALEVLFEDGRFKPVKLLVQPIESYRKPVIIEEFISYQFSSSVVIPVSAFTFEMKLPDEKQLLKDIVRSGDIVSLIVGDLETEISTGIVDTTELETDADAFERAHITGRDLMSQLEINDAVSLASDPIWANNVSIDSVILSLLKDTRIRQPFINRKVPSSKFLFATEPGESKLTALQRFLEPLNALTWMSPTGRLIVGRPNFTMRPLMTIRCNKALRQSNVISIKSSRSEAMIVNQVMPIWTGMESIQKAIAKSQRLSNSAVGPKRLYDGKHFVFRASVVSDPNASTPQGLTDVNLLRASFGPYLNAWAKRMIARENMNELIVYAVMPGHLDDSEAPFVVDTMFHVDYDRDDIDEVMYCFAVDYILSDSGPATRLSLCRPGRIVADSDAA